MEPGSQYLTTLNFFTLGTTQQHTNVVAGYTLIQQLAEHLNTGTGGGLVSLIPTISISSPTLITPRSTRPVTTVPRPEIENTSSIGIMKSLVDRTLRLRNVAVQRLNQLVDRRRADIGGVAFQRLQRRTRR